MTNAKIKIVNIFVCGWCVCRAVGPETDESSPGKAGRICGSRGSWSSTPAAGDEIEPEATPVETQGNTGQSAAEEPRQRAKARQPEPFSGTVVVVYTCGRLQAEQYSSSPSCSVVSALVIPMFLPVLFADEAGQLPVRFPDAGAVLDLVLVVPVGDIEGIH